MAMLSDPSVKYRPFPQVPLPDRQWPSRTITSPPRWLSTDLRDGNQAIVDPMDAVKKNRFFDLLVEVGPEGDRSRLPERRADRVRLHLRPGQVGTHSRRRPGPGPHPEPRGPDPHQLRKSRRRARGDRPPLQRGQPGVARDRLPHDARRGARGRHERRQGHARRSGEAARHRLALPVFAGNLLDRRTRFLDLRLRGGNGRPAADAGTSDHPQPARHGRGGDAQHLRRPDRVFLPQPAEPRERGDLACTPTTTAAPASPRRSWA